LPQPGAQAELHSPLEHESVVVCVVEHARPQAPQSAVFVFVLVSHPFEGLAVQWAKPVLQSSEQSLLHVPLTALQQVVPLQTTDPALSA
jgi:hypothetical protein